MRKFFITLKVLVLLTAFCLPQVFANEEAEQYNRQVSKGIKALYNDLACGATYCEGKKFLKQLGSLEGRPKLSKLSAQVGLGEDDPQLRWLIFEQAVSDTRMKLTEPQNIEVLAELQLRAFYAFQFQRVWELYHEMLKAGPPSSLYRAQIELLFARLLIFLGQEDQAYANILKVLTYEVFSSPDMINSELHQSEYRWAWYLLFKASVLNKSTQQAILIVANKYLKDENAEHPKDARLQRLIRGDVSLLNGLIFTDDVNKVFWAGLLSKVNKGDYRFLWELKRIERKVKFGNLSNVKFREVRLGETDFTSHQ